MYKRISIDLSMGKIKIHRNDMRLPYDLLYLETANTIYYLVRFHFIEEPFESRRLRR